jgi:hypothetical protein
MLYLVSQKGCLYALRSMMNLSTDFSVHFHDLYIDSKKNAKMTGD